jgi:hypothetical protein
MQAGIRWAIVYHTNSRSPRSRKWYHIARLVRDDDGRFFDIGRLSFESNCLRVMRKQLAALNLDTWQGVYTSPPSPHYQAEMIRVS